MAKAKTSAQQQVAAGPPPADDSALPKPLGVPKDFVVPGSYATRVKKVLPGGFVGPPGPGQVRQADLDRGQLPTGAPRYFEGDEYLPASMSSEDIGRLQKQLVDAGLLTGTFRIGLYDERTRSAYKNLLEFANSQGVDQSTALRRWLAAPSSDDLLGTGTKRAPLVKRKPNAAEVTQVFRDSARRLGAGRAVDDAEIKRFVDAYTNADLAAQQRQYDLANPDGAGGVVEEPPSAETFAEQQIKATHPVETESNGMLDAYNRFLGIITGGNA